ncbi:MAG: aryl-sulfate sulfotransferase [Halobacteriota archaeon]
MPIKQELIFRKITSIGLGKVIAVLTALVFVVFLGVSAVTTLPVTKVELGQDVADGEYIKMGDFNLSPRATLVGLQGSFSGEGGYVVLIDGDGEIVWRSPETWAYFDVSPLADGRVLSAFLSRDDAECDPTPAPCTGFRIYEVGEDVIQREWTYSVRTHANSEVHDVEILPNGNITVVGMEYERVFEVDPDGDIVWQWNASEHYDAPQDPTMEDWLHMNDVDRIGEGRYLVSVRNENQLIILDRDEGVVEVINEDGDPEVLNKQHNPQWLGDGRVLVADSGNDRVVELRKQNGTWIVNWELTSAGGIPFHWPRDADLLENGNILVTDSLNHRVVEVTPGGDAVWSVSPGAVPYEADRLPQGEYPDGLNGQDFTQDPDELTPKIAQIHIPLITMVFSAIKGTLMLPYWVNQWHFMGFILTLIIAAAGIAYDRRRR